jgi:hypothetical protein
MNGLAEYLELKGSDRKSEETALTSFMIYTLPEILSQR